MFLYDTGVTAEKEKSRKIGVDLSTFFVPHFVNAKVYNKRMMYILETEVCEANIII